MLKNLLKNIWQTDVNIHQKHFLSSTGVQHEHWGVACSIEELIALKQQARQVHFPYKRKSKAQLSGGKLSSLRGRGIDFDEVRSYQAGDEIRSIDWKVTARTGVAHTKVYREEKEKPVFILLDLRSPMFFGSSRYFKSVIACHCAALLGWSTVKNGDRLGALLFSDSEHQELKPRAGVKAVLGLINSSSKFSNDLLNKSSTANNLGNQSLASAVQKLNQVVRPGSLIYLLSDFHDFDEKTQQHLSLLGRHNDLIALRIFDPLEQTLPPAHSLSGSFAFTYSDPNKDSNAKLTEITELAADDKKIRQAYDQYFSEKYQRIETALLSIGISTKNISSAEEALSQLENRSINIRAGGLKK
jgi:uncharacterized protein (DUF58 family)